MSRLARLPLLLLFLTSLWVALWGDLSAGNVIGGIVVALGVLLVARPTGVTGLERNYFRPLAAAHYGAYFLVQLVRSNLIVAFEIVRPVSHLDRAIIRVPMHTQSAGIVMLVANSITLTPGTITVDVDERLGDDGVVRRDLFVHVLQLVDAPAVTSGILRLERLAIKAFGPAAELAAVDAALAEVATGTGEPR